MTDQQEDYFLVYKNKVKERYKGLAIKMPTMTISQLRASFDKLDDSVSLSEAIIKEREENRF
jgi:hypothetical protein